MCIKAKLILVIIFICDTLLPFLEKLCANVVN